MALVRSLRARVVLWVSVALIVLFAITIAGLDIAFRNTNDRALVELLEVQVLGLIAVAERARTTTSRCRPRRSTSSSRSRTRASLARCSTATAARSGNRCRCSAAISRDELPAPGQQHYAKVDVPGFPPLEALIMGITWEFGDGRAAPYSVAIAVSLEPYDSASGALGATSSAGSAA